MIDVHTVKLVEDPLRREPRNVGVIAAHRFLEGEASLASRFVGQSPDGTVSGRPIRVPTEIYQGWVDYFLFKLRTGQLEDVDRLMAARPTSFYLDHVVTLFDVSSPKAAVAQMYPALVTEQKKEQRDHLDEQIENFFCQAEIPVTRDVAFSGRLHGEEIPVEFAYGFGYERGRQHLADKVVASPRPQTARKNANDFAWRAHLAAESNLADSFVAFVDLANAPESYTLNELRSVYSVAHVADISRPRETVSLLRELARI